MCSYTTLWFIVITIGPKCFRLSLFSDINISQGSVATLVGCGGIFSANFIANFLMSQPVKELWKSANIWRSYRKSKKDDVFWDTVYSLERSCQHAECNNTLASECFAPRPPAAPRVHPSWGHSPHWEVLGAKPPKAEALLHFIKC